MRLRLLTRRMALDKAHEVGNSTFSDVTKDIELFRTLLKDERFRRKNISAPIAPSKNKSGKLFT